MIISATSRKQTRDLSPIPQSTRSLYIQRPNSTSLKLVDHYLIRVDNVWDEKVVEGIQMLNHHLYIEKERDRFERKRLYGIVEQLPVWLTGKNHQPLDPGWPNHRLAVGHDLIQAKINQGIGDYHQNWEKYYNLAGKEDLEYMTL